EAGVAFRRRHGLPENVPLLGTFGFQTPIKRTVQVLEALARPELAAAHCLIVGDASPACDLDAKARALGIEDRVHRLGFLPFDEMQAAIAACSICLNLRYPTAGETSASLLRILAAGRPAVVSHHAQMADLPADGLLRVPLGEDEVEALVHQLADVLAEPKRLERMGEAARRRVAEHHAPADAARDLIAVCRRWAEAEPLVQRVPSPATAASSLPSPTTIAWSELAGALDIEGLERPWPGGERRRLAVRLENHGPARWLASERPEGGVALEVRMEPLDVAPPTGPSAPIVERWLPLATDLPAGASTAFSLMLRRPLGERVRLTCTPHILGRCGFGALGGPVREVVV
ncbi:MAG: glycosyltransferase family 4 protein, partial [Acidobacteriota bacterium]